MRNVGSILSQLNNTLREGPYLTRSDVIHAKMVNLSRSLGIEVAYENLPNIESFLTNFNQLVLQCGVISKFYFCFDLPLSLLLTDLTEEEQLRSQERYHVQVSPLTNIFNGAFLVNNSSSSEKK